MTARAGFTLLELLLVMTIIGILAGTVTLGMSDGGARQRVQTEAERVALAIELARTEALTRNEIWGLSVSPTEYAFHTYDPADGTWRILDEPPFVPRRAEDGLLFAVSIGLGQRGERGEREEPDGNDDGAVPSARPDDDAGFPNIAILPGGEITPFEVVVSSGDLPSWSARSDGIGRVLATPQGGPEAPSPRVR